MFLSNNSISFGVHFLSTHNVQAQYFLYICQGITQNDCRTSSYRRIEFKQDMYNSSNGRASIMPRSRVMLPKGAEALHGSSSVEA